MWCARFRLSTKNSSPLFRLEDFSNPSVSHDFPERRVGMNIGLIGYGKMGKELERVAQERGFTIVKTFNSKSALLSKTEASQRSRRPAPSGPPRRASNRHRRGIRARDLVIGTTGW